MLFPLSLRIFILAILLVLCAVLVLAWQNTALIRQILTRNFQSFSLASSERISSEVEKFVIRSDQDLYRTIQAAVLASGDGGASKASDFLGRNRDAVAVAVLREMSGSLDLIRNSTTLERPPSEITSFDWLAVAIRGNSTAFSHFSVIELKSPLEGIERLMAVARRFRVAETSATFWGVALFKPAMLHPLFGDPETAEVGLATSNLQLLSGNFPSRDDWDGVASSPTFSRAVALGVNAAYLGESKDRHGVGWVGSFVRVPEYNLIIYIRQRAASVYERINGLIHGMALWSALIFLVAILASFVSARSVTKKLTQVTGATIKIANGDFGSRIAVNSRDEVGHLAHSVNWMAEKIAALLKVEKEKVRFEQEILTAQMVQDTFFSAKDHTGELIRVSGYHNPSSECCGDWWSHVVLPDGSEQIYIGDATGHGAGAALVTAMAYTTIRTLHELEASKAIARPTPADILNTMNKIMVDTLGGSMFMTFLIMHIDAKSKLMTYANAGHCFPYLMPSDPTGDDRLDGASQLRGIKPLLSRAKTRSVLGANRSITFENESMPLCSGDRIFLYTDGAFEFVTDVGRPFGVRSLQKLVVAMRQLEIAKFRDEVAATLEKERSRGVAEDDMTFVAVEVA